MPIVSKTFDYKRRQANGSWHIGERHTDARGRHHHFRYTAASEAEADAAFASRDVEPDVQRREALDLREHLEGGGTVGDFTFSSLARGEAMTIVRDWVTEERDDLVEVTARRKAILDAVINEVR